MRLGVLNIDRVLEGHLQVKYDVTHLDHVKDFPDIDALYIDWIPGNRTTPTLIRQAAVMDNYVKKKIPVILFDRHLRVSNKEYNWLRKFKVFFFEPAINYRRKFRYMPVWTEIYDISSYPNVSLERAIDLGCFDYLHNKLKSFEEYYVEFGRLYPKWSTWYIERDDRLSKEKRDEYYELNVKPGGFSSLNTKCSVLIGTQKAYEMGYLYPYIFDIMRDGCLPLLPQEHRYFHCLFSDTVIEKPGDINYILEGYNVLCIPSLIDIYERVEKYYPEMKVNHTVDVITKCLEE